MTAFKAYEKWDTLTAEEQETRLANHEEEFKAIAGDKEFYTKDDILASLTDKLPEV